MRRLFRLLVIAWDESELFALAGIVFFAGLIGFMLGHGL